MSDGRESLLRPNLPSGLAACPVLGILRRLNPETVLRVVDALAEESLRAFEITVDSPDALRLISRLRQEYPQLDVGMGTVRSVADALRALDAGAQFLVSPHCDLDVAAFAVERAIAYLPGAFTPTEVVAAWNAGAAAVKLFPASPLGPSYLTAIREPLPDIDVIAVGGINDGNALDFLHSGAAGVGVGSWLTAGGDVGVARGRFAALQESLRGL